MIARTASSTKGEEMEKSPTQRLNRIRRRALLKSAAALAAIGPTALAAAPPGAQPRTNAPQARARSPGAMFAYVGAFTTPERKGHGDGINVYRMDPASGGWTHVQVVPLVNPSFLAVDHAQRFLYSVHADLDEVSAYAIDKASGQLTPLNRQSCGGKNPVYLVIDPGNRFIVTANYGAGSVGVVPIEQDGTLGARADLATLPGEPGPNRKEQASSHPHECPFDRAGRFILVPDKGLDRVFVFLFDGVHGKLVPNEPPFVATREGAGPRHIAFHPSLPFAYVIDELDSTVTTYRYDSRHGSPQPVQVVPTTPPSFTGNNTGAEVAVAPVGTLRLRLQSRARQRRDLRRRSCPRDPDAGRLGADPGQDAALLWARPCGAVPLRRQPGFRHGRDLPRQPGDRSPRADRSGRQGRQPSLHHLCRRLESRRAVEALIVDTRKSSRAPLTGIIPVERFFGGRAA